MDGGGPVTRLDQHRQSLGPFRSRWEFFLNLTDYNAGPPFGGVTQTISTVVGEKYSLSFELGSYTARWGGPPVSILASAGSSSGTFTVSTTSSKSTWTPFSLDFTATSATTAITLTGAAGVNYIGLDNVSVDPIYLAPLHPNQHPTDYWGWVLQRWPRSRAGGASTRQPPYGEPRQGIRRGLCLPR
jgi:hypothetical protein